MCVYRIQNKAPRVKMSDRLFALNLGAGSLQLAQGAVLAGLVYYNGRQLWPIQNLGWKSKVLSTTEYELGWLVPAFAILSSANHFYGAFVGYDEIIRRKSNPVRWGEYAVTAGIMLWIVGTLSGVTDYRSLFSLLLANVGLQMVGYLVDEAKAANQPTATLEGVGFVLHAAIWVPIIISFQSVVSSSDEKPPDSIYSIVWILFALFTSFGILSVLYAADLIDYVQYETGFAVLSFTSKTFLAWIVYGGVLSADARTSTDDEDNNNSSSNK